MKHPRLMHLARTGIGVNSNLSSDLITTIDAGACRQFPGGTTAALILGQLEQLEAGGKREGWSLVASSGAAEDVDVGCEAVSDRAVMYAPDILALVEVGRLNGRKPNVSLLCGRLEATWVISGET